MMLQHRGSVCEPLIRLHVDYDAICLVFAVARELRATESLFPRHDANTQLRRASMDVVVSWQICAGDEW